MSFRCGDCLFFNEKLGCEIIKDDNLSMVSSVNVFCDNKFVFFEEELDKVYPYGVQNNNKYEI